MTTDPIRFIHLSDFHIGKDDWAQQRLFTKIIKYIGYQKATGFVPDFIFLTGDIANKGIKSEYEAFRKEFYLPLMDVLGVDWQGKIVGVPGNHDVARPANDALNRNAPVTRGSHFFDPTKEGKTARDQVLPRFKQYKQQMPGNVNSDWVASPAGSFAEKIQIRGHWVSIVGINTAWLSMDDKDQGKLTPGLQLVESALEKNYGSKVNIVLGHHPLHWLVEEHAAGLRTLFGYHKVVYLHGHMHRPEGRKDEGAGEDFLIFQAGAAFQARDDEPWRNGLILGEIDCMQRVLRLSPRYWNPDNYDWPVETGRFPEKLRVGDWWSWQLPGASLTVAATVPSWKPPQGWEVLDSAALEAYRRDILPVEAGRFFDGAEPDWSIALCPALRRRAVVGRLADCVVGYRGLEMPQVILLIGPGGEGKSMALRQTVTALLEQGPNFRILWRRDDCSSITAEQLMALPEGETPWLVVTDAADLITHQLYGGIQSLKGGGRSDVRFLLASRDSDWRAAGAMRLDWRLISDYHEEPLSGLKGDDAALITGAWASFGDVGLGKASGEDVATLANRLEEAARHDATIGDGALLGGMLALRYGNGLKGHVKSLMERLAQIPIPGGKSLCTAFNYIAVMHAERLMFLSRPVLAEALQCNAIALQSNVIFPLGQEAAGGGGTMLLTRHVRIAQAALEVMRNDYGDDIENIYVCLAKAAKVAKKRARIPELHRWEYDLPQHFLEHRPDLAIQIGSVVLEHDPSEDRLAVNLARLYRESGDPGSGAEVLRSFRFPAGDNRGFWLEWGICVGKAGDPALSALLAGWSVADQQSVPQRENDQAKKSLDVLGVAFMGLYSRYCDHAFIEARGAAGQLGLMLRLDPRTRTFLEKHVQDAREAGVTDTDVQGWIRRLQSGLIKAWELCSQRESLTGQLTEPTAMTFTDLVNLLTPSKGV